MGVTICFFNVNNLYLRYRFYQAFPGDLSGKSFYAIPQWGYLPPYRSGSFKIYDEQQTLVSAMAINTEGYPDILCVCEVESVMALRSFNEWCLDKHYDYAYVIDSRDYRQIDVGILSNKEIIGVVSHVDDKDEDGDYIFSRDCLEVNLALNRSGSKKLTLFINHLKSKFVVEDNKSDAEIEEEKQKANLKRLKQARHVRKIIRDRFPGEAFDNEYFAVLGDFNDQPDSQWIRPIVKNAHLCDAIGLLPEEVRWTYWWRSKNRLSQIDYLLLSPALAQKIHEHKIKPRIERRGIGYKYLKDGKTYPRTARIFKTEEDTAPDTIDFAFDRFPPVVETRQHASDHCPIFLELQCRKLWCISFLTTSCRGGLDSEYCLVFSRLSYQSRMHPVNRSQERA